MEYFEHFAGLKARKYYDEKNVLSLAVACNFAYSRKQKIITTVQSWGANLVDVISKKKGHAIDTQCYIMNNDEHVIVVFRGSESKADWFANFQATQDPGPPGRNVMCFTVKRYTKTGLLI